MSNDLRFTQWMEPVSNTALGDQEPEKEREWIWMGEKVGRSKERESCVQIILYEKRIDFQ